MQETSVIEDPKNNTMTVLKDTSDTLAQGLDALKFILGFQISV